MKPFDRLLDRLRTENGLKIPTGCLVRRTNAGRHQRAQGAWSWTALDKAGLEIYLGSSYSVKVLLRAKKIEVSRDTGYGGGGLELYPLDVSAERTNDEK